MDPALVSAIYSDFAGQQNAVQLAKEVLDACKESAIAEQLTDFDASASSGPAYGCTSESNNDSWATQTTSTEHSHLSNDLSVRSVGEQSGTGSEKSLEGVYWKDAERYSTSKKESVLSETFPNLRVDLIAYTLRKCGDDLDKATDELLNQVYFEETSKSPTQDGPIARGIEAFSEDHHVPSRGRKGKNKKKQKTTIQSNGTANAYKLDMPGTPTNRWINTSRDVDFITSHTNLAPKVVSSLYHANGASLSLTVLAIVRKDIQAHEKTGEPDASLVQDAINLNEGFPTIDLENALALMRLANLSSAKARKLAQALTEQPASETGGKGGIQLDIRYAPLDLSDSDSAMKLPSLAPTARSHDTASLAHARGEAFQQAATAYRRGKSTPLMRQVAAYYAQEGRDLNANLKAMSQVEADAFVANQSGPNYLDLHGVTVSDATRISKQRTKAWWDGLGEQRIREWGNARGGVGEGYRIVTGLGRHSEGGRGKIGPAVLKALMNEGWKVEVGTGELLVTGYAKKR